ncbi:MAG: c-type cytochrome biogenesis protein CcmF [Thiobacillus sp. 63-78]|uniref:heme lyase CcmF/NrfE family subunit n=1 Tax=Thiobacillus sp. 63-78 TaxID=1895859 RepID=UPI000963A046|nr:heme lyase CcmF/NrfE family subunit [Thiobacillus sp. 63-78]MBN8763613.1 heme lyase CcmF/NrfE family subunit [Thiobacillus sp.]MBN8773164.1 heme lyase CcmF/NrfE family subunit [Thiobacillus sp.]OJZ11830.1 MAG: c-type cytochrome biogenesis protein CcmF [Thiobacillus sp. 63-78]
MIPELGHFALIIALLLALTQAILPLYGAQRGNFTLMAVARPAAQGQFVFVAVAFACLAYSFLTNDFSVENVARNSFSQLPEVYRFTATWGSHEGSLLLWVLILGFWSTAVSVFSRRLPEDMAARVIGVMGLISVGFLAFLLTTSNPFERLLPAAIDGNDMNPLLQDWGMIIHPPMLYMGYVGFAVAFAFAIAALLSGKLDVAWARWSRPWTTVAWAFLTLGIVLGSWWAYRELGWGGWWFWDPTENASFMPWIAGTALMHSLAVTEKRGAFKAWTVLLALVTFALSLLGTFLVRSGVLSSVHAFATDPARGAFILGFLAVVIGASLALYAWRAPKMITGGGFTWFSRESLLLANNVILIAALGAVLLGTLYPLFMDAMGLGKISVGPPYFNAVFVPLMAPALFLMGIGPLARWKEASLPDLATRLKWALGVALAAGLLLPLTLDGFNPWASLGFFLAVWIALTVLAAFRDRLRHGQGSAMRKLAGLPRSFWGMQLAHLGIAVGVAGIAVVANYSAERDVRMEVGSHAELAGYTFTFRGAAAHDGPNYRAARGTVEVSRDGKPVATLHPEKRVYNASGMGMTEASVHPNVFRDLYVAMGEPLDGSDGAWTVRLFYKPFINWLWFGALLMVAGGFMAAADKRYRIALRRREVPQHLAAQGA